MYLLCSLPSRHTCARYNSINVLTCCVFVVQPPKLTDLCTICYTSGTTGNPKGVMLSHENVVAGVCSVMLQLGEHRPAKTDTMISYLPLAHMLERCCEVWRRQSLTHFCHRHWLQYKIENTLGLLFSWFNLNSNSNYSKWIKLVKNIKYRRYKLNDSCMRSLH